MQLRVFKQIKLWNLLINFNTAKLYLIERNCKNYKSLMGHIAHLYYSFCYLFWKIREIINSCPFYTCSNILVQTIFAIQTPEEGTRGRVMPPMYLIDSEWDVLHWRQITPHEFNFITVMDKYDDLLNVFINLHDIEVYKLLNFKINTVRQNKCT